MNSTFEYLPTCQGDMKVKEAGNVLLLVVLSDALKDLVFSKVLTPNPKWKPVLTPCLL